MAELRSLGQPFGGPSRVIIAPAPAPNPFGQAIERGAGLIGQAIGLRRQAQLEEADRALLGQALGGEDVTADSLSQALSGFQSNKFQGIADQLISQQLSRQLDPLGQQQREATLGLTEAKAEEARRVPPPSATQELARIRVNAINELQERDRAGTLLPAEKEALNKAVLPGGGINIDFSKGQLLTAATALRNEFNTDQRVKDFRILAPKFKNLLSFLDRSKKTGQKGPTDIALSKTFQKLTDLMSSVREGEYETTFRGQSLLQKLRGGIQKLSEGGEGITPEFRQELIDTARLMFEDGKLFFNQAIEEKGTVADAFGIPRRQILGNIKPFDIVNTEKEFADLFGIAPGQPQQQQPQGQLPVRQQPAGQSITATNQQTGQRIQSFDGGQTWQPIQ